MPGPKFGYPRYGLVTARGSVVTGQAAGTISGTWAVSVPTATVAGDYLIIVMTTNADTNTAAAGWTTLQQVDGVAVTTHTTSIYGKVATAADEGGNTYNWTVSGTTAAPDVATCWTFANVDPTKVVSAVGTEMTTSGAKTTPAVSITVPSLMLHAATCRMGGATAATFTYASGTKTEGTNASAVAYTAGGAPEAAMTYTTGSQAGATVTPSLTPTTGYPLQIGLGAEKITGAIFPQYLTNAVRSAL